MEADAAMKKKRVKVLFIFGTRPEAIKVIPVIREMQSQGTKFKVSVCVTAQHREMLDQVLGLFGVKPDYDLNVMTRDQSLSAASAQVLLGATKVIEKERPDIVFVQGDTVTTFAAAQASFYCKVPVAHIEAGLRTANKYSPFPEEINRRLTSAITDIHFAPTETARKNLIAEGFKESSIFVTGNTVIDALFSVIGKQRLAVEKKALEQYFRKRWGIVLTVDEDKIKRILVTGHRRESFGRGFSNICMAIKALAENNKNVQIIYPVHLNPHVQEPVNRILGNVSNVYLISPLKYEQFVFLMNKSYIILTDSGGIQEEAPSLGIPVLVMREVTERLEGIEAGSAKLVGTDIKTIVSQTQKLIDNSGEYARVSNMTNPYGDGKASKRIAKIVDNYFRRNA